MDVRPLIHKLLVITVLSACSGFASAQTFYFDGYGGFTDPAEVSPTSPADGADTDLVVGFIPPYSFLHQSLFDTEITAWSLFHWETDIVDGDHSHLSINELTPEQPPLSTDFADPVAGSVAADGNRETIGWLIHHNEVITDVFGPDNLSIHYHLDIYADAAKTNLLWSSGPTEFTLDVMETANNPADGVCRDNDGGETGNDTGFTPPNCADRFRFTVGWPVNPTGDEPFDQVVGSFMHEGVRYAISMSGFWDADGNLVAEAWSDEGSHNRFDVQMSIQSFPPPPPEQQVPAIPPLGLLLLAGFLGLAGAGALKSVKTQKR